MNQMMINFPEKYAKLGIGNQEYINRDYTRISKDQYFLNIANQVSKRSHDSETMHGCVIVKDGRILSTGFNGFPPGCPDKIIPNIRKDGKKYPFINHSEISAIFNCAKNGISLDGAEIYITGMPCGNCARALASVGILKWTIGNIGHTSSEEDQLLRDFWIDIFNIKIKKI